MVSLNNTLLSMNETSVSLHVASTTGDLKKLVCEGKDHYFFRRGGGVVGVGQFSGK